MYWYSDQSQFEIYDCRINFNTADHGGGLFWSGGSPTIINCTISGNIARGFAFYERDIYGRVISSERLYGGGAGFFCWSTGALIQDCVIMYNSAEGSGGGAYFGGDSLNTTLKNSLIADNDAVLDGGGIVSYWYANPEITNCTIANNKVYNYRNPGTSRAGGLSCSYESQTKLINSIVWGNDAAVGRQIALGSKNDPDYLERPAELTVSHSDIQGWNNPADIHQEYAGKLHDLGGNFAADPCFVQGYYLSHIPAGQDYNSPCIDAGSDTAQNIGLDDYTTRTDGLPDVFDSDVDLGYHYMPEDSIKYWLDIEVVGEHATVQPASGYFDKYTLVTLEADVDPGYRIQWVGTDNDYTISPTNTAFMYGDRYIKLILDKTSIIPYPNNKYETIQDAINAAEPGDTVLINEGTYEIENPIYINRTITVTGPRPDDPNSVARTVIDGSGPGYAVRGLIIDSNCGPGTVISGITFRDLSWAVIDAPSPAYYPSGITGGYARGGAVYIHDGASPKIVNCDIEDVFIHGGNGSDGLPGRPNDTEHLWLPGWENGGRGGDGGDAYGGAIFCGDYSTPVIRNVKISNCNITGGDAGDGGDGLSPESEDTLPSPQGGHGGDGGTGGNAYGGGIYVSTGSKALIIDCVINNATVTAGDAGDAGNGGDGFQNDVSYLGGNGGKGGENGSAYGAAVYVGLEGVAKIINTKMLNCTAIGARAGDGGDGGSLFGANGQGGGYLQGYWRNSAHGGAIYCDLTSDVNMTGCTLKGNSVTGGMSGEGAGARHPFNSYVIPSSGTAVFVGSQSSLHLEKCEITGNYATDVNDPNDPNIPAWRLDPYISFGGGISAIYAELTKITDCNITDNYATVGGGFYSDNSNAFVENTDFTANKAFKGAGIFAIDCNDFDVLGCNINGNNASDPDFAVGGEGGGILSSSTPIVVRDTLVQNNYSSSSGGGLYLSGGQEDAPEMKIINCLITKNKAVRDGAGISNNWFAETQISNCTIAHNMFTTENGVGGGIYCSYGGHIDANDSIIWANRGENGAQIALGGSDQANPLPSSVDLSYSCIGPEYDPNEKALFDIEDSASDGTTPFQTSADSVLIGEGDIYGQYVAGKNKANVIITLAEPSQLRAETDWNSSTSVSKIRSEIADRQDAVLSKITADEITVHYRCKNFAVITADVTYGALQKLIDDPLVAHIEPVRYMKQALAQAIPLANALEARQVYDGTGIAIAIVDTGVDYTHPMLGGGIFPNSKVIGGYDTAELDPDPIPNGQTPGTAHGTCCAGIAAGELDTVEDYIGGVAYGAKIYALKATPDDNDLFPSSATVAAWDWCVTHRNDNVENPLKVISNSWGIYFFPFDDPDVADAYSPAHTIAAQTATTVGITILAASGNDGFAGQGISWPSAMSDVISVGAVYDTTDEVTEYSNTDEILDILAPADPVYTTDITGEPGYTPGDYFPNFNGTSSACPFAAGAVADIQNAAFRKFGNYLEPQEIRELLVQTGTPVTDTKVDITKPRVNLGAAITGLSYGPPIYVEQGCVLNGWEAPDTNNYNSWQDELWDANVIEKDPNFLADYYLSQPVENRPNDVLSPCVNTGSVLASEAGMHTLTTRIDGLNDSNFVDRGYHHKRGWPQLTIHIIDVNGDVLESELAPGSVEPESGKRFPKSTVVKLRAYPDTGYRVKFWKGTDDDAINGPNNTVTMTEDKLVKVRFETRPLHELEIKVIGGHGGTIEPKPGTYFFYEDEVVKLVAHPDPNYRVGAWLGTDDDTSLELTNTVTMTQDKAVGVRFELPDVVEVSGEPNAIQQAIDNARDGDTLVVSAGTYEGPINFNGKAVTVTSTNPDDPNVIALTIIDCEQSSRGFVFDSNESSETVVEGFTVINGINTDVNSVVGIGGGGIYVGMNSSPTIRNIVIRDCISNPDLNGAGYGGGIYVGIGSSPRFVNCIIEDCNAQRGAGAYCDSNSSALFKHCSFTGNSSDIGGGICFFETNMLSEVIDCNISNNTAQYGAGISIEPNSAGLLNGSYIHRNDAQISGGGVYMYIASDVSIIDCNLMYNTAQRGAGIYTIDSSNIAIAGCEIKYNEAPGIGDLNEPNALNSTAVGQGGGIYSWGSDVLITDTHIMYNVANTSGGGLYLAKEPNSPTIINCLIASNIAGRDGGGASVNWFARPLFANCTIVSNAAPGTFGIVANKGYGGGLYCGYYSDSTVIDSILWNNYALSGLEIYVGTGFEYDWPWPAKLTVMHCDVKGGRTGVQVDYQCRLVWGEGNILSDPVFVSGPLGNYYLSQTKAGQTKQSPAVDDGSDLASNLGMNNYTTRTDELFDQGIVDMGYHYPLSKKAEPCKLCDLLYDGFIDFQDFAAFALKWLNQGCSESNTWCAGADFTFDNDVEYNDLVFFTNCWLKEDNSAPIPNPSQWKLEPYLSSTSTPYGIGMTAVTSYDAWGWDVEYYFECVSDSNYDSGWQSDPNYEITDLELGTELCFRVKAKDGKNNQTEFSEVRCAIVSPNDVEVDTTPPTPVPDIINIVSNSPNTITMTTIESYDASGVEYYFENLTIEDHNSGWQESRTYTDVNLAANTSYCYRVRARDMTTRIPDDGTGIPGNKTIWSDIKCLTTQTEPDVNAPTPDPMQWDETIDANGFDGTPHQINIGGGTFDWYVVMRADPNTVDDQYDVEFYFDCDEDYFDSGWRTIAGPPFEYRVWVGGKNPNIRFRVKARDTSPNKNETAWSEWELVQPVF